MRTVVVFNKDQLGHGDRELGRKVLGTFLKKSIALQGLETIVFFNAGVKLVAPDSPYLGELHALEERGVDIVPCGTCLAHYAITPAVGRVSDMDSIVAELSKAEKVITP